MSISPSISNVCEREEKEKECGQSYGKEQHRLEFQAAEAAKSIISHKVRQHFQAEALEHQSPETL
jgi:hypothetical protein